VFVVVSVEFTRAAMHFTREEFESEVKRAFSGKNASKFLDIATTSNIISRWTSSERVEIQNIYIYIYLYMR